MAVWSGNVDAEPLSLPHERSGDLVDFRRAVRLDVLEHRRVVAAAATRREHVHLPRVLVELDSGRGCDLLALFHQLTDEVAEIFEALLLREVRVVRQTGQRRDGVDRRVEDQLRPLGGPEVFERSSLQLRRE